MDARETREQYFTGAPSEKSYGYCRAFRVGQRVLVSGTTATNTVGGMDEELVDSTYGQARESLRRIGEVLGQFGLDMTHVVKTTVYFTAEEGVAELVAAHGEYFSSIQPASTAVRVSGMFHPDVLVEIEAEAVFL